MHLVKDHMVQDFKLLNSDISIQEAITQLADNHYGVIVNPRKQTIGLVTVAELEGAADQITGLSEIVVTPWIVIGSEVELQEIVNSPLLDPLTEQAKAAIVIDDTGCVVGVLPAEVVIQFIQKGLSQQPDYTLTERGGGEPNPFTPAAGLAGAFTPATALCICRTCGEMNRISKKQWRSLTTVPPGSAPMCQNKNPNVTEHPIRLT